MYSYVFSTYSTYYVHVHSELQKQTIHYHKPQKLCKQLHVHYDD